MAAAATTSNRERLRSRRAYPFPAIASPSQEGDQKANREPLRLEIRVTPTKHKSETISNREKEPRFSPPVGEGVSLLPGLALGVGWNLAGARGPAAIENSNREGRRLETGAKQTKQRIRVSSNREKTAVSCRHFCYLEAASPKQKGEQKANRESLRLETRVTPTKQKPETISNREKRAVSHSHFCSLLIASSSQKGEQKANRESLRLETRVTPTKQNPETISNREETALFRFTMIRARRLARGRTAGGLPPKGWRTGKHRPLQIPDQRCAGGTLGLERL
jgi:hypothetical protein